MTVSVSTTSRRWAVVTVTVAATGVVVAFGSAAKAGTVYKAAASASATSETRGFGEIPGIIRSPKRHGLPARLGFGRSWPDEGSDHYQRSLGRRSCVESGIDGAAEEHAFGNDLKRGHDMGQRHERRDAPLALGLRQHFGQRGPDLLFAALLRGSDSFIACRLGPKLEPEDGFVPGLGQDAFLHQVHEALGEVGRIACRREGSKNLRPFSRGKPLDQGFLGGEIDVERARADARLPADILHGRAVKAVAGKADLRRIEDARAPLFLLGFRQLWHI